MNQQRRHEVISRFYGGQSMRSIASALAMSRHTVKRVLRGHEQARSEPSHPLQSGAAARPSQLDAFEPAIRDLLGRYPQLTAVRLHEELKKQGFRGGYTIVRERLRRLRPDTTVRPVVRFETAPGAQAQMDWSTYELDFTQEGRRRVHLFSYVLAYSRRQYICFTESQDMVTLLRRHVAAFTYLGGVAATCLYDNMKTVVSGYDDGEPVYNTTFLGFASHYGFRPWACRIRRAQTKGKVERPFHYVENNLLNGRQFRSLAHLNEVARCWLAEVADVRVHGQTRERPVDRYQREREYLLPLPAKPYDTAVVLYRPVNSEGVINYRNNAYSVPWRHIGRNLALRVTEQELIIYGPDFTEAARHELFPSSVTGRKQEKPEHQPADIQQQKQQAVRDRFEQLGPLASRFFDGLVQTCRYPYQQGLRVLALLATYQRQDLEAALQHAVRYGAYSSKAIERILAAQARPKPHFHALTHQQRQALIPLMNDEPVRPRPTGFYGTLIPSETSDGQKPAEEQQP